MKRKKTNKEFIEELKEKNPNIIPLEEYIDAHTKIKCKCLTHNYIWKALPYVLLQGTGCSKCGKDKVTKSHEQFVLELKNIYPNILILDTYINSYTKIKCKCLIHNYEWKAIPNNLLQGYGCVFCSGKAKTFDEFLDELKEINANIEIIGNYVNTSTKVKCRCKIDGCEWSATPNNLLSGHGCPKCNFSKGEKAISNYLTRHKISFYEQFRFNDCKNSLPLPFDFYLPDYNICIEYDGELHYMAVDYFGGEEALQNTRKRDKIKDNYCKTNNIKLLRISYQSFNDIEKILSEELF